DDTDLRESFAGDPRLAITQLCKVETPACVVVHDEDGFLTGPNAKICPRRQGLERCAHLWPRRTGRPLEDPVEIAVPAKPRPETKRLGQLHHFVSRILQWSCAANRAGRWRGWLHVHRLAIPAESYGAGRPERVGLLDDRISLRTVIHNS